MVFWDVFTKAERYLARARTGWWLMELALGAVGASVGGLWAKVSGLPLGPIILAGIGGCVVAIAALSLMILVVKRASGAVREHRSGRGIGIRVGTEAPFHHYKELLHQKEHLIRVEVRNNFKDRALTNCELSLKAISGMLANKCPVPIKTGFTLNPRAGVFVDFVEMDESGMQGGYDQTGKLYAITAHFPINPLRSNPRSFLDHQPYTLTLLATAAESEPYELDCELLVENGTLTLRAANRPSTAG